MSAERAARTPNRKGKSMRKKRGPRFHLFAGTFLECIKAAEDRIGVLSDEARAELEAKADRHWSQALPGLPRRRRSRRTRHPEARPDAGELMGYRLRSFGSPYVPEVGELVELVFEHESGSTRTVQGNVGLPVRDGMVWICTPSLPVDHVLAATNQIRPPAN